MESPVFRRARREDLPAIVALLADDGIGKSRDDPGPPLDPAYREAFEALDADPNQVMAVAELGGRVMGYLQITYIPGLSRRGAWRAQIESVRIASDLRGRGHGKAAFRWAIGQARARGCRLVQLTSDKRRAEAHRFYAELGFEATHEGLKLTL